MRKHDFIETLEEKANITNEEATIVNEIIESHSIIGKNSKRAVEAEIANSLMVEPEEAVRISDIASEILATAFVNKIKHPFGTYA